MKLTTHYDVINKRANKAIPNHLGFDSAYHLVVVGRHLLKPNVSFGALLPVNAIRSLNNTTGGFERQPFVIVLDATLSRMFK